MVRDENKVGRGVGEKLWPVETGRGRVPVKVRPEVPGEYQW